MLWPISFELGDRIRNLNYYDLGLTFMFQKASVVSGALMAIVMLVACSSPKPQLPTLTPQSLMETTATLSPQSTSATTPTAQPTSTAGVMQPTFMPTPLSREFLGAPTPPGAILRLGKGWIGANGGELSPNGQFLRIRSSIGTFLYRADTFEELWYLPGERSLGFSTDSMSMLTYRAGEFNVRDTQTGNIHNSYDFNISWRHTVYWLSDERIVVMQEEFEETEGGFDTSKPLGVTLWDIETRQKIAQLDGKPRCCNAGTLHDLYVLLDTDETTSLIELATGKVLWKRSLLPENEKWSPDGNLIALYSTVQPTNEAIIVRVETGETANLLANVSTVYAWSPDSKHLIITHNITVPTIAIYDLSQDKLITTLDTTSECCGEIWFGFFDWSSDGTMVAGTYNHAGITMVWNSFTGEQIQSAFVPANMIYGPSVIFASDSATALVIAPTGVTRIDITSGKSARVLEGFSDRVTTSLAWSPDSQQLAMGMQNGLVRVLKIDTREVITQLDMGCDAKDLAWSPKSTEIYGLAADCSQFNYHGFSWNPQSDAPVVFDVPPFGGNVTVTWSPDRMKFATATHEGIKVGDIATGETQWVVEDLYGFGYIAWSPDGNTIAVSVSERIEVSDEEFYWQCQVVLLNAETGETVSVSNAVNDCLSGHVLWFPDGHTIALETGVGLGSFPWVVIDVATGHVLYRIDLAGPIVAFSPDSSIIAAPEGGTIILRDARTGAELRRLEGHYGYLWDLEWSPDGRYLASTSIEDEATVIVWDLASSH